MWKNALGMAILLMAGGFALRSLQPAHAEIGPSSSLGTNPVAHFSVACSGGRATMMTNNSTSDFIVTDFIPRGGTYTLYIDGSAIVVSTFGSSPTTISSGIRILPGETLSCSNNYGYRMFIAGHYAHP